MVCGMARLPEPAAVLDMDLWVVSGQEGDEVVKVSKNIGKTVIATSLRRPSCASCWPYFTDPAYIEAYVSDRVI